MMQGPTPQYPRGDLVASMAYTLPSRSMDISTRIEGLLGTFGTRTRSLFQHCSSNIGRARWSLALRSCTSSGPEVTLARSDADGTFSLAFGCGVATFAGLVLGDEA